MESGNFYDPVVSVFRFVRGLLPTKLSRPKLNYIHVHYLYIIGFTIFGSIMLFPKDMTYINALFFAAGSSTQSGLNPVDINQLYLYQQVVLMLIACVTNPIFINTAVVFVRLYWFEKRFINVVEEVKAQRKSRAPTMTRSKSQARSENDLEMGRNQSVGGRKITVLRPHHTALEEPPSDKTAVSTAADSVRPTDESNGSSDRSDSSANEDEKACHQPPLEQVPTTHLGLNPRLAREITFADEVTPASPHNAQQEPALEPVAEPSSEDVNKHIAFLEKQQRARKESAPLRIPGPRAFERGEVPEELDDDNELDRNATHNTLSQTNSAPRGRRASDGRSDELEGRAHARAITIETPEHPARRPKTARTDDEDEDDDGEPKSAGAGSLYDRFREGLSRRRSFSRLGVKNVTGSIGRSFTRTGTNTTARIEEPMPYLSWAATTGRNSAFMGLTSEQREELGGIEYRSLKMLAKILVGYYVGFHLLGSIVYIPWILRTYWRDTVLSQYAIDPTWWGIFTASSMFTDLGFTLTPTSMNEFNTAVVPLLLGSFLIIIGNTGFPCMLRFTIWVLSKLYPYGSRGWEELRFLLDHPRRCFTLLFPSKATWWLFWVLVLFNGVDLIFFIILDLNDETVLSIPPGFRVLDGWFQATSTRTAGFSCVNLAALHPGIQVSYLLMMYISVFPIAISVRRTNVYEEKSLGIWGGEESPTEEGDASYVGQHLRRQLSFDLWYVFLGLFIIAIVEGDRLENTNDYAFTIFSVLFEIVSAYGTVGLSLGYPNTNASFSAQFRVISKLVIAAMMIRGRHRGLPYALDRAILLPSDNLHRKDEELARQVTRRASMFAESNQLQRRGTWQEGELDGWGLPKQHTASELGGGDPMTEAAGGDQSPEGLRRVNRRASTLSQRSARHRRSTSFSQFVSGALGAGPTHKVHL